VAQREMFVYKKKLELQFLVRLSLYSQHNFGTVYLSVEVDVLLLVKEAPLLVERGLGGDGDLHYGAQRLWFLKTASEIH
jgi:hypothetical protein